jgi:hypothetical protein
MTGADDEELAMAADHARRNVVPAWPGRKCIDGRYEPGQASGMIGRPGADLGYVMVLLAACHDRGVATTPAAVVDAVWQAVTADGGAFYAHTDDRTGLPAPAETGSSPVIGCRHVAAAADPALAARYFSPSYRTAADDVRLAVAEVVRLFAAGERVQLVTLRGVGSERGVLVVTGTARTVNPASALSAYYVYDQTRDETFLDDVLVPRLAIDGVTAADIKAAARTQLAASLRAIAPGKPVFLVDVDHVEPTVAAAGPVETYFQVTGDTGTHPKPAETNQFPPDQSPAPPTEPSDSPP